MGVKITAFFAAAENIGGLSARVQLAAITKVTSTEAVGVVDTPELCKRFEAALATVRERYQGRTSPSSGESSGPAAGPHDAERLRVHIRSMLELMSQRALVLGDVHSTCRRVNEAAASALDVARVSVWMLDGSGSSITCADLFERETAQHSQGLVLSRTDFPAYFDSLATEQTIAAHDANRDPRTSCFSESYLTPLGIGAMLDVPIWVGAKMVGVVCHEHVGGRREWNSDEETFGYLLSNFVALALELDKKTRSVA